MTAVRGTFADFKTVKTRGVCQLIIEVPIESADHALAVLGGVPQAKAEQWVGIAPVTAPEAVNGDDVPAETEPTPAQPSTEGWSEAKRKMVMRSGIVRKEEAFQKFLAREYFSVWEEIDAAPWPDMAAEAIHRLCFVKSCRDLNPAEKSGWCFTELMARYDASQRGDTEDARLAQRADGPS